MNYGGITLTCLLSKVLEKIVHSQLCKFLHSLGILSANQYGFRRGHSCSDLLLSVIDDWLLVRDRKLSTAIIFINLSKAFDNVQHQQLLILLKQYGVGGIVLAWIRNFQSADHRR